MIRIVNLRNYKLGENERLIKIDRSSYLGNPFYMKNESHRDEVCEKYEEYFDSKIVEDEKFKELVHDIAIISLEEDVALGCWCSPKRCHAETIKSFIENVLYPKINKGE